jgi:receptor-interacting serine/threonine-protein kinase 5
LDHENRGKLTDFGTCVQLVMTSEEFIGTPLYMAPEMVDQEYDTACDVYAFAVLFWFICSNNVVLPANYESCDNHMILLQEVRRGLRPERVARVADDCWDIMTNCWHGDPKRRPHLSDISRQLKVILDSSHQT